MTKKLARIISVILQKGGVGKTTTVVNLSAALSLLGHKVLAIDFDPQGNLTSQFFTDEALDSSPTIYDLLKEEAKDEEDLENPLNFDDVVLNYKKDKVDFDILPATPALGQADFELISLSGREFLLRKILNKIDSRYDFILIDCPPSLGILTINALSCSDNNELIITVKPAFFSKLGIKTLNKVRKNLEKRIAVKQKSFRYLITLFDERKIQDRQILREIEEQFSEKDIFETKIRLSEKVCVAPSYGLDIFNFAPNTNGTIDYMNLAKEILKDND